MYAEHCKNLLEVENGIDRIELDLRRFISMNDIKNEYTYTKILSQLITCWAEVRIMKVLHELNAFTQIEIDSILQKRSATLQSKWEDSVKSAFTKAYTLNSTLPIGQQLNVVNQSRYIQIMDLIANDLSLSITLRNRIAHGQWRTALTSNLKSVSSTLTQQIIDENIVSLQLKKKIMIGLALIINDLAVSPATFERDFDKHYRLVAENKVNLHNRNYSDYRNKMILKYQRGLEKRRALETSQTIRLKNNWLTRIFKRFIILPATNTRYKQFGDLA